MIGSYCVVLYWRDSVSLLRFHFLSHIHVFSCVMLLISRLKRPLNCFSSNFCFLFTIVLLVLVLSVLSLLVVISLPLRFCKLSLNRCIDVSILSLVLASPLPSSFLDTYSLSTSSLWRNVLCRVISFLVLWFFAGPLPELSWISFEGDSSIPSVRCRFPIFITSMAHFSMPNSIPLSWLYIHTACIRVSNSSSFLANSLMSSISGVLQGDTLAPYLFIICLDYVLRTSIDKIRENGFELTKRRSKRYPAKTITDADYADDLALLANTPNQAETLLHSLERAAAGIGLHVNANKTEYMCYNQTGNIATLDGASLKLVDKFTYLGSSVSSTEKDIDTRLTKAWTAIDRLSIIWKSDLTDKMKRSFFQAAVVSILLYGCTTWTLTKRLERRLDGNYTRMLRAVLNKSWRQHPTRLQLYGHLPPITKTIQVRRTRHAGHCWRSKDELISDVLLWTPTHGCARVGRPARTYIQQLCEDTGCNPEDLPEAMNDREKWRETVRDIRAGGATWWWWWWYTLGDLFFPAI